MGQAPQPWEGRGTSVEKAAKSLRLYPREGDENLSSFFDRTAVVVLFS